MKVDLSKPAFGPDAQKVSELSEEVAPVAPQAEEAQVEEPVAPVEPSVEEPTEEQKVPYSRFKKFHDLAQEAQREAEEWRARAEELERKESPRSASESGDVPSWWSELYGDTEASQKAWKIQERANQQLIEEARQQALEAVQGERQQETERVRTNEEIIDQNLERLSDYAGHELSEREQSAILDIVDEYTPKDDDGNYLGPTIPFEKAWDIYELKQTASKAPRVAARNKVAELTGSPTQGEPSVDQAKNESFNPLDWNAWKKRI